MEGGGLRVTLSAVVLGGIGQTCGELALEWKGWGEGMRALLSAKLLTSRKMCIVSSLIFIAIYYFRTRYKI